MHSAPVRYAYRPSAACASARAACFAYDYRHVAVCALAVYAYEHAKVAHMFVHMHAWAGMPVHASRAPNRRHVAFGIVRLESLPIPYPPRMQAMRIGQGIQLAICPYIRLTICLSLLMQLVMRISPDIRLAIFLPALPLCQAPAHSLKLCARSASPARCAVWRL